MCFLIVGIPVLRIFITLSPSVFIRINSHANDFLNVTGVRVRVIVIKFNLSYK